MSNTSASLFVTVRQLAMHIERSPQSVRRYIRQGIIHGVQLSSRARWIIPVTEAQRLRRVLTNHQSDREVSP